MAEITIEIPKDLVKEFEPIPEKELSLLAGKLLKERLEELTELTKIVSKSKLTEAEALKLAKAVNRGLAKRYKKLKK